MISTFFFFSNRKKQTMLVSDANGIFETAKMWIFLAEDFFLKDFCSTFDSA